MAAPENPLFRPGVVTEPQNVMADVDRMNQLALGPLFVPRDPTTAPIGAGAGPVTPFRADLPESRPPPLDNYRKPLDAYAPTVFHEASPSTAHEMLPGAGISNPYGQEKFVADHPDLALGQGANANGVQLAFNASKLQGQINRSKPAWEVGFQDGLGSEYVAKGNDRDFQSALIGVRVPNNLDLRRAPAMRSGLQRMTNSGWTARDLGNGFTEYLPSPPQP